MNDELAASLITENEDNIACLSDVAARQILSDNDLKEEQIDLLLPELCFLFRIAGIAVKKSDPLICSATVLVFMWVVDLLMTFSFLKHVHEDHNANFSHLVEIYWAFHSCVIYTMLAHAMYNDSRVFQMILLSAQGETDEWRCNIMHNQHTHNISTEEKSTPTQKSLRVHSRRCVYAVIFCVSFNLTVLISTRFSTFLSHHLPWSESIFFNLVGVLAWYFYSFHWFVAVLCVYLPVHFFSSKVKLFVKYLENSLTGMDREEVVRAMDWYDDLYKVNRKMNFESLSLLATTTLFMLMLLLIGLLLSAVKDPDSFKAPLIFWICTNSLVISAVAYTVAELETANKK